jgi:ferredoxin-NADP reductase
MTLTLVLPTDMLLSEQVFTELSEEVGMTLLQPFAERILGSRALAALTSPHGVDRYLEHMNPMWAATEVRARVVEVKRETDGPNPVATLTLQPTSTWRGHRAGQYVQVGVEINGNRRTTRCFSISSAESNPGEQFSITVRAHEEAKPGQQRVSKFLVREAQPGQILHLSQAEGQFTLSESPATPTNNRLLMISGGSGITPVMAQIRTLLRDGYDGKANRKVTFLHYARSQEDQIFADELMRIAWADNGIDVHLRHGDELFTAEALAKLVPDYRDTDTWACGPAPMMALVAEAYGDSPRLRTEFFKLSTGAPVDGDSADGDISFTRTGATATNSGASLLEQAEAQGLTPEYGCRMGICFSCVSRKTEGTVRNVLTGEESSLPDEDIRICVSAPVGNCSVDL